MSFLFGSPSAPQVAPLPPDTSSADNQAARDATARDATIKQRAAGRSSTMVAGMSLAADNQKERGLLYASKRTAAKDMVGG